MATVFTQRAIIVARPAFAAKANAAAKFVDTEGGDQTFTVPLRLAGDATGIVRGYWCSWAMRPADITALRTRLKAQGATDAEIVVVTRADKDAFVPSPTARCFIFDARDSIGWTPQEVLDALGVDTIDTARA